MKKVIDVKSLIIGVLATALFFTLIGAKKENNANFDTITVKGIRIVNLEGKTVAFLGGTQGEESKGLGVYDENGRLVATILGGAKGGGLWVYNAKGKVVAALAAFNEAGGLGIYDEDGKSAAALAGAKGRGAFVIYNKGKPVAFLGKNNRLAEGLWIYNKEGKTAAYLVSNLLTKEGDLAVYNGNGELMDLLCGDSKGGLAIHNKGLAIYNKKGKLVDVLTSDSRGGLFAISSSNNKPVVMIHSDKNGSGVIDMFGGNGEFKRLK